MLGDNCTGVYDCTKQDLSYLDGYFVAKKNTAVNMSHDTPRMYTVDKQTISSGVPTTLSLHTSDINSLLH